MEVVEDGEFSEDRAGFLVEGILTELDFPHIETSYPADFEVLVDDLMGICVSGRAQSASQDERAVGVFL